MTTTNPIVSIREQINNEIVTASREYAFAAAVQSAMYALDGKSVTRRIVDEIRDILGWKNATIHYAPSDEALELWKVAARGGETGRDYNDRLTAYLGSRGLGEADSHSVKCVNFIKWRDSMCKSAHLRARIDTLKRVDAQHIEGVVASLAAFRDAERAWKAVAESSPIARIVEGAAITL